MSRRLARTIAAAAIAVTAVVGSTPAEATTTSTYEVVKDRAGDVKSVDVGRVAAQRASAGKSAVDIRSVEVYSDLFPDAVHISSYFPSVGNKSVARKVKPVEIQLNLCQADACYTLVHRRYKATPTAFVGPDSMDVACPGLQIATAPEEGHWGVTVPNSCLVGFTEVAVREYALSAYKPGKVYTDGTKTTAPVALLSSAPPA